MYELLTWFEPDSQDVVYSFGLNGETITAYRFNLTTELWLFQHPDLPVDLIMPPEVAIQTLKSWIKSAGFRFAIPSRVYQQSMKN